MLIPVAAYHYNTTSPSLVNSPLTWGNTEPFELSYPILSVILLAPHDIVLVLSYTGSLGLSLRPRDQWDDKRPQFERLMRDSYSGEWGEI